jgi:hypothetical protein
MKRTAMTLMLSDYDLGILLSGTLMNWGYPFVFTRPYRPDPAVQELIDAVVERYQRARRENHERQMFQARPVELSPGEAFALIATLEACLKECRGNSTSIHLHLEAEDEDEVLGLIGKLGTLRG